MDKTHLDALNGHLASLGVTRHQWIVDTTENYYDEYPLGFDLLEEAAESAHRHGLEFHAVVKSFEDGGYPPFLPLTMPFPKDSVAFKDIRGISPVARPFAARHPEMSLKRRPGTFEYAGPVKSIRLVKGTSGPTRIKAGHLSIWTSPTNNRFVRYDGPVAFRETVERRFRFPKWRRCRVLHLENLDLPKEHSYILIRCALSDGKGDFSNENGSILELVGPDDRTVPHTLSSGPVTLDDHNRSLYQSELAGRMFRYPQMPEVQAELADPQRMREHYRDYFGFGDSGFQLTDWTALDRTGYLAAVCGKPEFMLGNLNPVYPEVRGHWLDLVRYCLDRGVDGINLRVANHTRSPEYWEYGFNQPVLDAADGQTDHATASRINGEAYTAYLREARELIKSRGKALTVHLNAGMLMPDDRGRPTSLPPNFEWQWKTWVREIGDAFEFRGGYTLRPWNLKKVLDTLSVATRGAKKPLYYQTDFHGMGDVEGRALRKRQEIELVRTHGGLDGLVLYTTNNYTKIDERGRIELAPFIKEAVREYDGV